MAFFSFGGGPKYSPETQRLAALSLGEFTQANALFNPIEEQAIKYAQDPLAPQRAAEQAEQNVSQSYQSAAQTQQQQLQYQGLHPTADQTAAMQKSSALSEGMATAQAENLARRGTVQNQQALLGGLG